MAVVAHLHVLLPAEDRAVGPAEGDEGGPVREQEGQGGELGRLGIVVDGPVTAEADVAEARAGKHEVHQKRGAGGVGLPRRDLRAVTGRKEGRAGRRKGDRLAVRGQDAAEIGVAQLGQDEAVHRIERRDRQRHVPAPGQIIENVHTRPPWDGEIEN